MNNDGEKYSTYIVTNRYLENRVNPTRVKKNASEPNKKPPRL